MSVNKKTKVIQKQLFENDSNQKSESYSTEITLIGVDSDTDVIDDVHKVFRAITPATKLTQSLLLWLAEKGPIGHRITYLVATHVIHNWFNIVDPVTEVKIPELNLQVEEYAKRVDLRKWLIRWLYGERWGGWAIVVDWTKFKLEGNKILKPSFELEVFTRDTAEIIWDTKTFLPKAYKVTKTGGPNSRQIEVPADIVYHLTTRGSDPIIGQSAIDPVGYDLITLFNLAYGTGQTFFRQGMGFPVYRIKNAKISDPDKAVILNNFKNLHKSLGMVMKGDDDFDFKGAAGAVLDPEKYIGPIMKRVSAGSGVPKMVLEGAQAGALASSETDQLNLNEFNKGIQSLIQNSIETLLEKSAGLPDSGWKIKFNEPQLSRKEQLEIEEAELDIKEKRMDLGLEPDTRQLPPVQIVPQLPTPPEEPAIPVLNLSNPDPNLKEL